MEIAASDEPAYSSNVVDLVKTFVPKLVVEKGEFKLSLHIGILFGNFQHVILGDINNRTEYCVYGESLSELSVLLDNTVAGELQISNWLALTFPGEIAFSDPFAKTLSKVLNFSLEAMADNPSTEVGPLILNIEAHEKNFASIVDQYDASVSQIQTASPVNAEDRGPYRSMARKQSPVLPRQSNQSSAIAVEGLPDPLYRFVNTSFLSRVANGNKLDLKPDYRRVSVLFVKLAGQFNAERSQLILVAFLGAVRFSNGVFQHFSVDDKGQNMLEFFGIPPFTHENSALFAAKAALKFANFFDSDDISLPAISLLTFN
ncbi:hypothetical protein HDU97_005486 [Phlyctochytrium planicorne]|nr:hypothetical protein HDU97_005486 [Phlyctochytrium planicorne]